MTNRLDGKKYIFVLHTTPECPLTTFAEVLVYSWLANQSQFNGNPTEKDIATATGLDHRTVEAMLPGFRQRYCDEDGCLNPPSGKWFVLRKHKKGAHWSHQYAFWPMYVRSDEKGLTQLNLGIYSYLRNCALTRFRPKGGWNKEYLASVFRMSVQGVREALDRLQVHGLLTWMQEGRKVQLTIHRLGAEQLINFVDADPSFEEDEFDIIIEDDISVEHPRQAQDQPEDRKEAPQEGADEYSDREWLTIRQKIEGILQRYKPAAVEFGWVKIFGKLITEAIGSECIEYEPCCRQLHRSLAMIRNRNDVEECYIEVVEKLLDSWCGTDLDEESQCSYNKTVG